MDKNEVLMEMERFLKAHGFVAKGRRVNVNMHFVNDLGMDSLDVLDLFTVLEKKFRIRPFDDTEKYKTVGNLADAVMNAVTRKKEKAFPPKGNGIYYLADGYPYCSVTDKPCDKIDLTNVSAHNFNQCKKLKCSVWMHNNKQKTK